MIMTKSDEELHYECMHRFVELANEMTKEGISKQVVSAGLMTSSGVFSTYEILGNSGQLNEARINTLSERYRTQLTRVQAQRGKSDEKQSDQKISDTVERIVSFPEDD